MSMENLFGNVISSYSRADALADGSLIDVTDVAKEAGFKFPVAVTQTVWGGYIDPSQSDVKNWGQDVQGRLWDTLTMLAFACRSGGGGNQLLFSVIYRIKGKNRTIQLKATIGPGDTFDPVMTIMLVNED